MDRTQREADLRRRILGGDTDAWDAWYAECFDALWIHVARRLGDDRARIEDLVQETWLTAVRRIESFDPALGSFRGWVHGIATHVLANATRRRGRRRRVMGPLGDHDPPARPSNDLDARELLAASFAGLPDHYREVLRAKYVEERSIEEIAAARETTPKAVESLLGRARGAFREIHATLVRDGPRPGRARPSRDLRRPAHPEPPLPDIGRSEA